MKKYFVATLVCLMLLAIQVNFGVFAEPISINITAEVALVDDPGDTLGGVISVGDIITGTYIYESTTPDSNPLPTVGDYWHSTPPYGITINAGELVFKTDPDNVDFLVEIVNDHGSPPRDNYLLRSYNNIFNPALPNGAVVDHISWQLDDPTATALSSEVLPTVPPVLDDWQSIFGLTITGFIPDPDFPDEPWPGTEFFIRAHVISAEAAGTGSINGHVTDIEGNPLKALVIVINADDTSERTVTVTDVDGYYEIEELAPGDYFVLCFARRHKFDIALVEVVAGESTPLDFQLEPRSVE